MRILREKVGVEPLFFIISLVLLSILGVSYLLELFQFEINVLLLHTSMFFLGYSLVYEKNFSNTINKLFGRNNLKNLIIYFFGGMAAIFIYLVILSYASGILGIGDQHKVIEKVNEFTPLVIFAAIFLGPISEEILFRAYLVKKTGIILSSVIFALAHIAYGSIVEVLGAFGIGIILAYIFKEYKNILPCILIHFSYNLVSLLLIWWIS